MIKSLTILLASCFFLLAATSARAQSLSLSLWPPILEVIIKPGKSLTQVYELANNGENDLALTSSIVSFLPQGELGDIQLRANNQRLTTNDYLSFQNADLKLGEKFMLKSGQKKQIVLKIKILEEAPEEDYYQTLLFETLPSVNLGESAAAASAKIGSHILLTVSKTGEPLKKLEISEFSSPKIIDSFDQPRLAVKIKNSGNNFFKAEGEIKITGWFGQKFSLSLLPENILANSTRQIRCQNSLNSKLCILNSKFLFGRYQAELKQAKVVFWAWPLKLIFALLTIIIMPVIIRSRLINAQRK